MRCLLAGTSLCHTSLQNEARLLMCRQIAVPLRFSFCYAPAKATIGKAVPTTEAVFAPVGPRSFASLGAPEEGYVRPCPEECY
jgi:hypothetical protein